MEVALRFRDSCHCALSLHEDVQHLLADRRTPVADENRARGVAAFLQPGVHRLLLNVGEHVLTAVSILQPMHVQAARFAAVLVHGE